MKKKALAAAVLLVVFLCLTAWIIQNNTALELTAYTIKSERMPEAFEGYRIAQVSDLHNAQLGNQNETLLAMLKKAEPNMIAITGDLVDSRNTDIEIALQFAHDAVQIAPCYYVTGNHESRISEYEELKAGLEALGVTVLENMCIEIECNGESIALAGVDDPAFQTDQLLGDAAARIQRNLEPLVNQEHYTVLLSHRPELFAVYVQHGVDLVLAGHAHGGQFRLPVVGGIYAPGQGFFPVFDAGVYTENATNMVVSRGIGNSIFPFRINNRPELVLIELMH
ncbi:MAG: metallophosphoesterase [Oscillospiraceae bacterium]|nr:metallophosphoesterase [Oscillospiraceae bacterium]